MAGGENTIGNPICSICYEDLQPVAEDLQSISVCGHVFHELCLQQWFEYCGVSNKRTCPVCKQNCNAKDACRLFFQSAGNQSDSIASQKVANLEEDPAVLRGEVKRLEGKVLGLTSALEGQKKEITEVNKELCISRELLNVQKELRLEALQELKETRQVFESKSGECDRLTSQCRVLEARTMALAKELAAFKLVSDLSLQEEDVLKLASMGNEFKTKDTVDILVKSLVIRNRSYKELLAKCNNLGRGEARSSEKLEKATEKINKLKMRVRELERIIKEKENGALRALKVSTKCSERDISRPVNDTLNSSGTKKLPSDGSGEQITTHDRSVRSEGIADEHLSFMGREDPFIVSDDEVPETTAADLRHSDATLKHQKHEDAVQETSSIINNPLKKDVAFNIRRDFPQAAPHCNTAVGDICFSGGLLGPDGTKRYLGKWCKRAQTKGSPPSLGSISGSGDLIGIGHDGRGGKIKVLRSQAQIPDRTNSGCAKRFKSGTRTSVPQSQGYLQIEHFFGKTTNH